MGTTRTGEEHVRVLNKTNTGTYTVSLPIAIIRQLKWQVGQKLTIEKRGKSIVITDWN